MAYVFETVPAQRDRVDMTNPSEVWYWKKTFGCSEMQLEQAVAKVGNSSAMVEQLLDGMVPMALQHVPAINR